jgi:DNA segregation ATPase FtsK/SpoIIIE-like protein
MQIDKQLIRQAKQIVSRHHNYSISFLQRKLEIGYNRAAILIKIIKQTMGKEKKLYMRLWSKKKKRFRYVK